MARLCRWDLHDCSGGASAAEGWYTARSPPGPAPEVWFEYAEGLLSGLNGRMPCSWSFVGLFAAFGRVNEENEAEFKWLITALHRELVRQSRDFPTDID
jgi:hypothetical protein